MASGEPEPPSHILMLSAIWQLLSSLAFQAAPVLLAPPNQELLLEGMSAASKRDYKRAADEFMRWAFQKEMRLDSARDFDYAFWQYAHGLNKSRVLLTLAALERLWPPLKRAMPWSRARAATLQVVIPTVHHPPMLWPLALAVA